MKTESNRPKLYSLEKCSIYLWLPLVGEGSTRLVRKISRSIQILIFLAICSFFILPKLLKSICKNVIVILNECIGRTNQMLEMKIDQHIPANILKGQYKNLYALVNTSGFAIAEHVVNNPTCALSFINSHKFFSHCAYIYFVFWRVSTDNWLPPSTPTF